MTRANNRRLRLSRKKKVPNTFPGAFIPCDLKQKLVRVPDFEVVYDAKSFRTSSSRPALPSFSFL